LIVKEELKMKSTRCFSLLLVIALELVGCVPAGSETIPTQVKTPVSSLTNLPPTSTSTITSTATITPTLYPTLQPKQAKETVMAFLQEPMNCETPCFWGIMPGQTTFEEATNIFAHLGISLTHTNTRDNKDFYSFIYNLDNGLEVTPILTVQDNTVKSLQIGINDTSEMGTTRKWTAYSPETLISRYGAPSKIDFFLGRVAPTPTHSMNLYFEKENLIVEYIGINLLNTGAQLGICPLTNKVDFIGIWMGEDPHYPPSPGVPLEEATSLTLEEFSNLMKGDPKKACFNLKEEAFPQ
jgi:hypothetical protein